MRFVDVQSFCMSVLSISRLDSLWPIDATVEEALAAIGAGQAGEPVQVDWEAVERIDIDCGTVQIMPGSDEAGAVEVVGHVNDVLNAAVTSEHVHSKRFSQTEFSIGLGALGDKIKDYLPLLGEMITIGGTMAWLPTDGNDTPDFLIPVHDTGQVAIRTAFNATVAGPFNEVILFASSETDGTPIGQLYRALFDLARERRGDFKGALALGMRAEMATVFGSGIVRSPIREFAPTNGKSIIDESNIKDWFEGDAEPRYRDVTALVTGVGLDLSGGELPFDRKYLDATFYINPANVGTQDQMLHNHSVIFPLMPMEESPADLDAEIRQVIVNSEFLDMRHLLDTSQIRRALIGASYTQQFRPDPSGRRGHH